MGYREKKLPQDVILFNHTIMKQCISQENNHFLEEKKENNNSSQTHYKI